MLNGREYVEWDFVSGLVLWSARGHNDDIRIKVELLLKGGGDCFSELMKFIDAGDMDAAGELIKSFEATAGGYDIGLLLKAISKYYISNPYKMDVDLTEAGL